MSTVIACGYRRLVPARRRSYRTVASASSWPTPINPGLLAAPVAGPTSTLAVGLSPWQPAEVRFEPLDKFGPRVGMTLSAKMLQGKGRGHTSEFRRARVRQAH